VSNVEQDRVALRTYIICGETWMFGNPTPTAGLVSNERAGCMAFIYSVRYQACRPDNIHLTAEKDSWNRSGTRNPCLIGRAEYIFWCAMMILDLWGLMLVSRYDDGVKVHQVSSMENRSDCPRKRIES
jgi:hypothetical protein